ncbi:TPA: hypothetical protein U8207_000350 [Pseudomonas putida]|nr:hypothetical protein [Pseudomonas putida]
MTKHTAEPWDLMQHGVIYGGPLQHYANGSSRSQIAMSTGADFMAQGEQQANARRIVACVNICAGISTDDLERHSDVVSAQLATEHTLQTQRDDLLSDLQLAAAQLRKYETLHRAKGTADSLAKAEVNAELASRFEQTIAQVTT